MTDEGLSEWDVLEEHWGYLSTDVCSMLGFLHQFTLALRGRWTLFIDENIETQRNEVT